MKSLILILVLCYLSVYNIEANPAKTGGGGRRGGSGSRGSSWSTSWSRPAAAPAPSHRPAPSYPASTGLSGSSNSKPSYPSHSYPTGSGNSGSVAKPSYPDHSYPASPGLSGSVAKPSYPAGPGLSGGAKPSYPVSTGLSGGAKPSYPASTGLSGGAKPSYPAGPSLPSSNVGTGGYKPSIYQPYQPANPGSIQTTNVKPNYNPAPVGPGGHTYPSGTNVKPNTGHGYPSNPGLSGGSKPNTGHGYPSSPGLSGGAKPSYPAGSATNQATNVRPNYNAPPPAYSPGGYHPHTPGQAPPPYNPGGYGGYHPPSYGAAGYHPPAYGGGYHPPPPTYYGGIQSPPNYPVISPSSFQPVYVQKSSSGLGFAGSALTGVVAGLAAYNIARVVSGSNTRHVYHHYDDNRNGYNNNYGGNNYGGNDYNRGGSNTPYRNRNEPPPPVNTEGLENCTLSINGKGGVDTIMIPCEITTSFVQDAPKPVNGSIVPPPPAVNTVDNDKEICTISVIKHGKREETSVPCDFLSNQSKNVTYAPEPPVMDCQDAAGCKYINPPENEDFLRVIPLKKDDNKLDNVEQTTEGTKVISGTILMDPEPNTAAPAA